MSKRLYDWYDWPENLYHLVFQRADCVIPESWEVNVEYVLNALPERDKDILVDRLKNEKMLGEIGIKYGLTKERIRQLEFRALKKIRCNKNLKSILLHGLE